MLAALRAAASSSLTFNTGVSHQRICAILHLCLRRLAAGNRSSSTDLFFLIGFVRGDSNRGVKNSSAQADQ